MKKAREEHLNEVRKYFNTHPIVGILGPRQCGKTTLAHLFIQQENLTKKTHFFDLEDPTDVAILENPKTVLQSLKGLIVLDEIQHCPDLFPVLRVLVDRDEKKERRFLILGSASRELLKQSSESLAGRIAYTELTPFSHFEVDHFPKLWLRGGFPKSYLARVDKESYDWRKQYIHSFLERDIPNLGINIAPVALRRFWMMLTHYHGQTFNAAEIGKSLGIAATTVRNYLDILTGTFMVRQLLPWYENLKKRQVKTPKIYFRDSGIFHTLSNIHNQKDLIHHPKLGASWEGFMLEEVIRLHQLDTGEVFYWCVHNSVELDLFFMKNGKRIGYEFKYNDAPKLTRSMQIAFEDLKLDELNVIYPGEKTYSLSSKITVQNIKNISHCK